MNKLPDQSGKLRWDFEGFGEFKHNHSTFTLSDDEFEAKYRSKMLIGGMAFHFK